MSPVVFVPTLTIFPTTAAAAKRILNPFTAPACKIFGLKDGRACRQDIFRSYNPSTFNAMRFDENPFTRQREKEIKRLKDFRFRTFIGRFQVTPWQ